MIRAIIPNSSDFALYKNKLKKMYKENQAKINDTNSFDFIIQNTLFYGFINENCALIGAIYFFVDEDGKLFLNAYAGRGHHEENLECVRLSTTWFSCDIYAEAQNRASALCLLRCGFKRLKDNIFVFRK